jgi:hypothetical protein
LGSIKPEDHKHFRAIFDPHLVKELRHEHRFCDLARECFWGSQQRIPSKTGCTLIQIKQSGVHPEVSGGPPKIDLPFQQIYSFPEKAFRSVPAGDGVGHFGSSTAQMFGVTIQRGIPEAALPGCQLTSSTNGTGSDDFARQQPDDVTDTQRRMTEEGADHPIVARLARWLTTRVAACRRIFR